jgi:hypothetical protein
MSPFSYPALQQAVDGKLGIHDIACPLCGPDRRSPANRVRKVLRVWYLSPNFAGYVCARCGERGYARCGDSPKVNKAIYARISLEQAQHADVTATTRRRKALTLWRTRTPLKGTVGERYLREARAYGGALPPTLGFLPARGVCPPAMIAAFGIPDEIEPGVIALPDAKVKGIHLTRLALRGSDRDRGEKAKIMIGHSAGWPIVLSPPTDGQALIIAEGIEDALSGFEATGLCAWVAGSASRLPALGRSIPAWTESVTLLAHGDVDGRKHGSALIEKLSGRRIECRFCLTGAYSSAA